MCKIMVRYDTGLITRLCHSIHPDWRVHSLISTLNACGYGHFSITHSSDDALVAKVDGATFTLCQDW